MSSKYICLYQRNTSVIEDEALKHDNIQMVTWDDLVNDPILKSKVEGIALFGKQPESWKFEELPQLKVISNCGAGVDHLNIKKLTERGVKICNTPTIVAPATAEIAWGLMICAGRRFKEGLNVLHIPLGGIDSIVGYQVTGSTLGIVGLGAIGSEIAKRAAAFDMKIYYNQRNQNTKKEELYGATYCKTLHEMLPLCDFVVLCCPYSSSTHHLISKSEFDRIKKGSFIINVGRGGLIDTNSLISALQSGHLGGAGLDVTDPEPLPVGHPLMDFPNVMITPHLGTNSIQTRRQMAELTFSNLLAVLNGKDPEYLVKS